MKCNCGKTFTGSWAEAFFAGWVFKLVRGVQIWICPGCRKDD